jgi:RNA polymerase sigma factor (sigma-70 family)
MRAAEFITEVSQYRYWNPASPPAATTPYDARQMGKQWKQTAKGTMSARQDPERRYYAGRNPLADPVPMDDPAVGDIPDDEALAQLERGITQQQLQAAMRSGMSTLTPREREVLHMRFYQDMTLQQVADYLGVVRARVQQIEAKALRKMRHSSRADALKPFVDAEPSRQQAVPPAQAPTTPNLDRTPIAKNSPEWNSYMAGYRLGQRAATPIAYEPDRLGGVNAVYPTVNAEAEAEKAEDYYTFMAGYESGQRKPLGKK